VNFFGTSCREFQAGDLGQVIEAVVEPSQRAIDGMRRVVEGDDLLGDAYEYLMKHFAVESGKSKAQLYPGRSVPDHCQGHWRWQSHWQNADGI
jgi:type I restriction-modification system DNA methylase subunit